MAYNKFTIQEKIAVKTIKVGNCLIWIGDKDPCGYGRIRYKSSKSYPAHKLVYELAYGDVPPGLVVMHSCDNPSCVEISHLSVGTQKQNVQDSVARGRAIRAKGESHGRVKLTQQQVNEIRQRYIYGTTRSGAFALAREFGVSSGTIWEIAHNKSWVIKNEN